MHLYELHLNGWFLCSIFCENLSSKSKKSLLMDFFDFHSQNIHFKTFGVAKLHMFFTLILASSIQCLVYVYRPTPRNTQIREADWTSFPNLLKNSEIDACITCSSMQWVTTLSKNLYRNWIHTRSINFFFVQSFTSLLMAFFDFHFQNVHFTTFGVAKKHMFFTLIRASSIHCLVYVYRLTPKNTQIREADWASSWNLLRTLK